MEQLNFIGTGYVANKELIGLHSSVNNDSICEKGWCLTIVVRKHKMYSIV